MQANLRTTRKKLYQNIFKSTKFNDSQRLSRYYPMISFVWVKQNFMFALMRRLQIISEAHRN